MIGLCSTHPYPDLWFPEQGKRGKPTNEARELVASGSIIAMSICNQCPIQPECLTEGMKPENLEHGIWGGLMAGERILAAGVKTNRNNRKEAIAFAKGVRAWQSISSDSV